MKIAIINLTAGGMSGGYRKYLFNLLPRISANTAIEKTICVLPSSVKIDHISDHYKKLEFYQVSPYRIINIKLYSELKIILDKFKPDVVYVPVERSFIYKKAPVVNMLQNMEPFICPFSGNPIIEKIKNYFRMYTAKKALKRADSIIAISNFVKDYLEKKLFIDPKKIKLAYHGVDKLIKQLKKPAIIPDSCVDFLFTAGSIRPARGLEDILKAMRYLKNINFDVFLVIAGNLEPVMINYQRSLIKWIDRNHLSANIIWAGNLNEPEMAWCYSNCSAFVMTSRVESFGLIALEAMSYGCLCVSANNPCLPEIFSDAAFYYNSGDGKALSMLINNVLSWDQSKKKNISKLSLKRASQFSWDICAEKTIEQLQLAIKDFNQRDK